MSALQALQALSQNDHVYREKDEESPFVENELSKDGLAVSEAEYWKKYHHDPDFTYEWNNGYLEERPKSDVKGWRVYRWFWGILESYFPTFPIGEIFGLDIGFRLALPHKTSIRKPDLSVILDSNPVAIDGNDSTYSGTFDLCVESLSHFALKEIKRDTVDKKKEYEGIGVREYYILDARKSHTAFYGLDKNGKYKNIDTKGIVKSTTLPGFQFRISDLYRQPPLDELVNDDIYRDYVMQAYKKEKQRADNAEQQAEKEKQEKEKEKQRADSAEQRADSAKQRADKEKHRAEQLAAKLRALGVDV
ncbi:Uma2 family endonuclease [Desulfobacterales bacterium HSG16]|nr:Uma2 family endonuclease [Desulfobacterales bacterium HSG16]